MHTGRVRLGHSMDWKRAFCEAWLARQRVGDRERGAKAEETADNGRHVIATSPVFVKADRRMAAASRT